MKQINVLCNQLQMHVWIQPSLSGHLQVIRTLQTSHPTDGWQLRRALAAAGASAAAS